MPTTEEGQWNWEEDALDASSPFVEGDKVGRRLNKSWVDKVKGLLEELKSLFSWASYDDTKEEEKESESVGWLREQFAHGTGFRTFVTKEGTRWLAFSSNAFKDREGEIFTTKALEEAVKIADETGERGPLRLYHIPGADVGVCDFQGVVGRFLVESGIYEDTPMGRKAEEYFLSHPDEKNGISIGFRFKKGDEKDHVYDWTQIFERSVCPAEAVANPWTQFLPTGGKSLVQLDEKKKGFLAKVLGQDLAEEVITVAEGQTKTLEEEVAFKEAEEEKANEAYPLPRKKAGDLLEALGTLKMLVGKVADAGLKKQLVDVLAKASDSIKGAEGYGYPQPGKKEAEEEVPADKEESKEAPADKSEEEAAKVAADETALVQVVAKAIQEANASLTETLSRVQEQVTGLVEGQEGLKTQVQQLATEQEGQKTQLTELGKSEDEKVVDLFKAKSIAGNGQAASGSDSNVIEDAEKTEDIVKATEGEENKSPAAPYVNDFLATVGGGKRGE